MATKTCPTCGAQYLAAVQVCPDCDVELTVEPTYDEYVEDDDEILDAEIVEVVEDDDGDDEQPDEGGARAGELAYELHEWAVESRQMLQALLAGADIPFAWQGTDLVVPAAFEERVDELVEQVEVTTLPTLDPDADKLAYDLDDWDDVRQERLFGALDEAGIPWELDVEGSLVVLEVDGDRVEELIDAVEFPDALEVDEQDADADEDLDDDLVGIEAADVLSEVFVAADRLKNNPRDADGVLSIVDHAGLMERLGLPFGFGSSQWEELVSATTALRDLIEGERTQDDEIADAARSLRDLLRPLV
ncbi:MAG: hypothetical protein MUF83_22930 [Acidimicrobiales bacterium]|nr:hypothetical protein [Acidimicrobiales bacterium]